MEKKYLMILLSVITLVSCQPTKQPSGRSFTRNIDSVFDNTPDFSGVILIAEDGNPIYHKAFGYKNFPSRVPLDTADIFELASVSKQFTSMIIMMLHQQGLLDYDDAVEKYIPGLPYNGITIRHLLNHTSGLPDYQAIMDHHWDKSKVAGNEENIEYLKKYHPTEYFMPGEKYDYSNTGYMLLASIAENVSGKDFIQLCREWIFIPLKMSQTDIRTKSDKVKLANMAWGYIYVPEKQAYVHADSFPAFNYSIWLGNRKGPGRVSSTTSDLLKWDQALYTETLVKREILNEAYTAARLNNGTLSHYGFGWSLSEHPRLGRKMYHTGDNPGFKTIIVRYTDINKTIIVLCNNGHEKFDDLIKALENEISRGPHGLWRHRDERR